MPMKYSGDNLTFPDNSIQSTAATGFGFKNRIINGAMMLSQRGTSGTANNGYTLDRWILAYSGTAPNWNQATGGFVNGQVGNLFQISGAAGNTWVLPAQRIEAANSKDLAGQTATVSYEIYQNTGSAMSVTTSLYYANSTDNFNGGTTLIANSSAQSVPSGVITKVTATFSVPSAATTGIEVRPCSQLQALGAGQAIQIGNVQLEKGSTATSFDYRPYGTELALCQRYYEKSFNTDVAPAQNSGTTGAIYFAQSAGASTTQMGTVVRFKVEKRASPSLISLYNPNAANAQIRNDVTNTDWSSSTAGNGGTSGFRVYGTSPSGSAAGNSGLFHWSVEAEL